MQKGQHSPQALQGIVFSTMGVPKGFEFVGEIGVVSGNATVVLPKDIQGYREAIEQARFTAQQDLFRSAQTHGANSVLHAGFTMSVHSIGVSVLAYGTACVVHQV